MLPDQGIMPHSKSLLAMGPATMLRKCSRICESFRSFANMAPKYNDHCMVGGRFSQQTLCEVGAANHGTLVP